jgi:hypothetical protein
VALFVLAAALLSDRSRARLAAIGGGLALAGLAVPLALIALGTTTAWPFVWSSVAGRARIAFAEGSLWTDGGEVVRGPEGTTTMRFADDQRVSFRGRGIIHVEPREGMRFTRDVEAGEEVALHPGDRLVVPGGLPLRFEAGRRVPDAPDSGPEWVEPSGPRVGWRALLAFGVTGLLGMLGLPAGLRPMREGRLTPGWGAPLGAALLASGLGLVAGWSLYAAWLAAALAGLHCLPGGAGSTAGVGSGLRRRLALLLVAGAGLLACLVPLGAWAVLLAALGLAASALAPAAVLATWSERATPRSVVTGATVGLGAFIGLILAGVAGPADGWVSAAASAPAALAVLAHLLAAWLVRSRDMPTSRHPLSPGLEGLSATLPAGSRGG